MSKKQQNQSEAEWQELCEKVSKPTAEASEPQAEPAKQQTGQRQASRLLSRAKASLRKAFRRAFPPSASVPLLLQDTPEGLRNALTTIRQLAQEGYSIEAVCIGKLQEPPQFCPGCRQCQEWLQAREAYTRQRELVDEILSLCRYVRFAGLPIHRLRVAELLSRRNKNS